MSRDRHAAGWVALLHLGEGGVKFGRWLFLPCCRFLVRGCVVDWVVALHGVMGIDHREPSPRRLELFVAMLCEKKKTTICFPRFDFHILPGLFLLHVRTRNAQATLQRRPHRRQAVLLDDTPPITSQVHRSRQHHRRPGLCPCLRLQRLLSPNKSHPCCCRRSHRSATGSPRRARSRRRRRNGSPVHGVHVIVALVPRLPQQWRPSGRRRVIMVIAPVAAITTTTTDSTRRHPVLRHGRQPRPRPAPDRPWARTHTRCRHGRRGPAPRRADPPRNRPEGPPVTLPTATSAILGG